MEGMGNGMEVVGWEGWSFRQRPVPDGDFVSLFGAVTCPVRPRYSLSV